jgi:hypothetical protein
MREAAELRGLSAFMPSVPCCPDAGCRISIKPQRLTPTLPTQGIREEDS